MRTIVLVLLAGAMTGCASRDLVGEVCVDPSCRGDVPGGGRCVVFSDCQSSDCRAGVCTYPDASVPLPDKPGASVGVDIITGEDVVTATDLHLAIDAAHCPIPAIGCADGTREGFEDLARYPDIAVCAGVYEGLIDGPSARALCCPGWHVCRGDDARVHSITGAEATAFPLCYAYDAAQDCNRCSATCRSIADDPEARCPDIATSQSADGAGMGAGCGDGSTGGGMVTTSCLPDRRLDVSTNTFGCWWDPRSAGVVCCRD
jgi:hypothetical protein